ncbi:MAG TPA: SUMF1/EgtB/PvdO family nonheme iron enzyme [Chitinophagaceae bacterium]|nr:SUMF1/EgtB/PvdO family nonheme iron enzyme [Chitinophagaceae bacterium]HMU57994.1 SUMF1/EgtB/PvdO family nonheme iron enzyme [Chitinophagaceae bacterium]
MMKYLLLILFVFIYINGISQNKRQKKFLPPGTVRINDTLFADESEVSNLSWRECLYYFKKYDSLRVVQMLPDTTVWGYDTTYGDTDGKVAQAKWINLQIFSENYFRHPGFNNYPVVGISYDQAIAFCNWRTKAANFVVYCKENKIENWNEHINDSIPIKFYYRLPTKEEWEMIASGSHSLSVHPFGFDSVYKKWKKKYVKIANCVFPLSLSDSVKKCIPLTATTKSYFPNSFKVYNTIGNVSEMVMEYGVAKGGSFAHKLEECRIANNQSYTKPEGWLGFRCVAVMIR